jgi:hypothetical protein
LAAVQEMGRRGFKGALRRIEPVVLGKLHREIDLTERMRFFEAYALIARDGALETLSGLMSAGALFKRKESPEVRACALSPSGRFGPRSRATCCSARPMTKTSSSAMR